MVYAASVAKQFTGACIAELILTGRLSLDTMIRQLVPALPSSMAGITIDHLVSHTSGLPDSNRLDVATGFAADHPMSNSDRIRALDDVRLDAAPGTQHRYSNYGYVLLAEAARTVASQSFGELARQTLLDPAGMHASDFLDVDHPTATPGWSDGRRVDIRFTSVGDGGLVTTLSDLVAWNSWLPSTPLGELVLGERPTLPDGTVAHDAWGISIRPHHGLRIESHGGAFAGYLVSFVRFPSHDCAFIAVTNDDHLGPQDFNRRLRLLANSGLARHLDHSQPAWTDSHGLSVPT